MENRLGALCLLPFVVALVSLQGCSSPPPPQPEPIDESIPKGPESIGVRAAIGQGAMGLGIAPDEVQQRVEAAIRESGLFSVDPSEGLPRYELRVEVVKGASPEPTHMVDTTWAIYSRWKLVDFASGAIVLDEEVRGESTATRADATDSFRRNDLAIDGAMKAVIDNGVARLSKLGL